MKTIKKFYWIWMFCILSVPCLGQDWSASQNVSDPTSSINVPLMDENPVLGIDGQGNAISVWIGQDMASVEQLVKASRFDAVSGTWGSPVTIGSDVAFSSVHARPTIAVTANGKAMAIWRNNADGSLHYNVFDTNWIGEGIIDSGSNESFPKVGVDASGNAVAIWQVGGNTGSGDPLGTGIMSATFNFNTALWGSSTLISVDNSPNFFVGQPALAVNASGQAIASWLYADTGTSTYMIQSNFYTGGSWGTQESISSTNPASFVTPALIYPDVTLSPTGQAIALFYQYDASMTPTQDYIVLSALRNGSWATPFPVSSVLTPGNTDVTKISLNLTSNSSSDAIGVWELAQGTTTRIEATTFSDFSWNNDTTDIATETSASISVFSARVAMDDGGDAFATWYLLDTGVPMTAIQVSQYSKATNTWGSVESISTPGPFPVVGEFFFPSIAANASGAFVDIWYTVPPPFTHVLLQGSTITLSQPLQPPAGISGKQKINRFPVDSERFNQIKWIASPTLDVVAYEIFRNGVLIATVPANALHYQDHNRLKNTEDVYSIFAVSSSAAKSAPVTITIP